MLKKRASVDQLLNPSFAAAQPQHPPTATGNEDNDEGGEQVRNDRANKAPCWGGFEVGECCSAAQSVLRRHRPAAVSANCHRQRGH